MRLLVINANTSQTVTDLVAAAARAAAAPGTEIVAVTGRFGARVIGTRTENAIAAHAGLELAAEHHGGCDAVVIGVSLDTALDAMRELLPIPVVGMTEAAVIAAGRVASRFGLITFGQRTLPMYRDLIAGYGVTAERAVIRAVDVRPLDAYSDPQRVTGKVLEAARGLISNDGAEAIVLAGAAMAGMHTGLQPQLPVPVLDGIACGVALAEMLVRLRLPKPATGSLAAPPPKETVGLAPALADLFRTRT